MVMVSAHRLILHEYIWLNLVVIVVVKLLQLYFFDEIRALSLRQNGKGKFNVTNFIIFNLMFMTLLAGHFYFYNFIYYSQIDPCFGNPAFI